jgi:hypothetical protein
MRLGGGLEHGGAGPAEQLGDGIPAAAHADQRERRDRRVEQAPYAVRVTAEQHVPGPADAGVEHQAAAAQLQVRVSRGGDVQRARPPPGAGHQGAQRRLDALLSDDLPAPGHISAQAQAAPFPGRLDQRRVGCRQRLGQHPPGVPVEVVQRPRPGSRRKPPQLAAHVVARRRHDAVEAVGQARGHRVQEQRSRPVRPDELGHRPGVGHPREERVAALRRRDRQAQLQQRRRPRDEARQQEVLGGETDPNPWHDSVLPELFAARTANWKPAAS